MAVTHIDTIRPEMLRWAFERVGVSEENTVTTFPPLKDWLSREKHPVLSKLKRFAEKFFVSFGYLFLGPPPPR